MGRDQETEGTQTTVEELRRAILYVADAMLALTNTVDLMAMQLRWIDIPGKPDAPAKFVEFAESAWAAQGRLRQAVDLLVKPDATDDTTG